MDKTLRCTSGSAYVNISKTLRKGNDLLMSCLVCREANMEKFG